VTDPLIAKQRIEDAQNFRANVAKKRREEAEANRQSYEKFYNQLALLSGGSIALSVTYLGYLKTVTNHPRQLKLLVASWAVMFLCLVCATFYSFFNTSRVPRTPFLRAGLLTLIYAFATRGRKLKSETRNQKLGESWAAWGMAAKCPVGAVDSMGRCNTSSKPSQRAFRSYGSFAKVDSDETPPG